LHSGFILDGFPRNVAGLTPWGDATATRQEPRCGHLWRSRRCLVERLTGRRTCKACGRGYHVKFDPPKVAGTCDACGGELIQRDDDKEETIRKRLEVYHQQTAPLVAYYRTDSLLTSVDGMREIDTVQRQILSALSAA
jgi:adenylate kinase